MTSGAAVRLPDGTHPVLPPELRDIEAAIQESRTIAELEDDWDGEGSPGYAEATLERAVTFLVDSALTLWKGQRIRIPTPVIGPGPDSSIDINWQLATRTLLVNVPADAGKPATFYGSDRVGRGEPARNLIEGCVDIQAQNHWLLMWIAM